MHLLEKNMLDNNYNNINNKGKEVYEELSHKPLNKKKKKKKKSLDKLHDPVMLWPIASHS